MRLIFHYLYLCLYLVVFYFFKIVCFIPKILIKDKIYLFLERGYDAEDNAYIMYRYFKDKGFNCKYLITKNSKDIIRLDKKDIVIYKSFYHHIIIHLASVIISTHIGTFLPLQCNRQALFKTNGKVVFLQHGITKDSHPTLLSKKTCVDFFVSGAKKEYDFLNSSKYGYKHNEVHLTGLARFDDLYLNLDKKNPTVQTIFIMPTWRQYLDDKSFPSSKMYESWMSLLNNKTLNDFCQLKNIKIIFNLHKGIIKYRQLFEDNYIGRVVYFEPPKEKTIHEMIIESDFLITDFSSVFFDFAFLEKPMCFYFFDEEEFFAKHYPRGYFDYDRDGFGPVSRNENDLVNNIIKMCENGVPSLYQKRMKEFFIKDCHSRERIFDGIQNMMKK